MTFKTVWRHSFAIKHTSRALFDWLLSCQLNAIGEIFKFSFPAWHVSLTHQEASLQPSCLSASSQQRDLPSPSLPNVPLFMCVLSPHPLVPRICFPTVVPVIVPSELLLLIFLLWFHIKIHISGLRLSSHTGLTVNHVSAFPNSVFSLNDPDTRFQLPIRCYDRTPTQSVLNGTRDLQPYFSAY